MNRHDRLAALEAMRAVQDNQVAAFQDALTRLEGLDLEVDPRALRALDEACAPAGDGAPTPLAAIPVGALRA
jgi:hypothetical protein